MKRAGARFCGLLAVVFFVGAAHVPFAHGQERVEKLDLNRATLREIQALPIPAEVANAIYEYRTFASSFQSAYDLMNVDGVTPEILRTLIPLVSTLPPLEKSEALRRYEASFQQVQRFLAQENASEELADELLDQLRDPRNVNNMSLHELQSLQNVSPVDAVAVIKARQSAGRIDNERQLRGSENLSYWGFRNLRDYVVYADTVRKTELHGDVQLLTFNTPFRLDERDLLLEPIPGTDPTDFEASTGWGLRGLDAANPALLTKVRLRLGKQFKGGFMTFRNVGEENLDETIKGFVSWENPRFGSYQVDRVVVGNFRVAFGQGVVMDNTDFGMARKSGFGWNKRPKIILGDLSRSHEFALRGLAVEGRAGRFRGIGFFSRDEKDGLLNPDGSINKYVVMYPRFENAELADMSTMSGRPFLLKRDAFRETLFGGLGQVEFWPGTFVGISGWEASYGGKRWDPNVDTIIPVNNQGLLDARDSELFRSYDSRELGDFRRVFGAEFQTVYKNLALQGEYGKLDSNPQDGLKGLLSSAPEAYVLNAFVQFEDLNLLALWRDYDVGFDNPYARTFDNAGRFQQSLVGDPFRLENPLLSWLSLNNVPQSAAERGLFLSARYRVSRNFTITGLEFDQYTRQADGQDLRRYTLRMEYAPIWPLRFRVRQRVSSRGENAQTDVRGFTGWDTRLETRVRLSGFDELRLLYSVTQTQFAPRPRLSGAAQEGEENPLPQAASPSQALQAMLVHNVNERLMFTFSTEVYDGFLWNFEDNEFIALDDVGFRNWFLMRSRLSDQFMVRFKLTSDKNLTRTNVDIRNFNDPFGFQFEGDDTRSFNTSFRLQLDYTF